MSWTAVQVLALAPDTASAQAGKGLATPSKWMSVGSDSTSVWGLAKGSAAVPYQTCIDLSEPAFKCSCPSRKFPCKHGLGLFLLFADGKCSPESRPAWVEEWLSKRAQKSEQKLEKAAAPPDPEAKAKRAAKREDRVREGVQECEIWLRDLIRSGFSNPALMDGRQFERVAARMVDSQATGLARLIRKMGATIGSEGNWQEELLHQCGSLHLLLTAFGKLESLSEPIQDDVRQMIGWTYTREELAEKEQVLDRWLVVGQRKWIDERITVKRTWIYGSATKRWGMLLSFVAPGATTELEPPPGSGFEGKLVFYPGSFPYRVQVLARSETSVEPCPAQSLAENFDRYSDGLSANPWIEEAPFILKDCTLARENDEFLLKQNEHAVLLLKGWEPWNLLAMTGNHPSSVFGEWNGMRFRPLSLIAGGQICSL